jgi:hypothetical protein
VRHVDLHGLSVLLDDRLEGAPSAALLGRFPDAELRGPAALRISLRPRKHRVALPEEAEPSFFHGAIRAVTRRGALLLGDGASVIAVSADGASIEGAIHEATLVDPHAFAHGTLLLALVLALRHHGLFHLHGAAMVSPRGASVLVAGDAGAGKSTVALALAKAGFSYLGDDSVLLSRRRTSLRLLAIPRAFHVGPATADALPDLARHVGAVYGSSGKRFLDPTAAFPEMARMEAGPPEALLFPSIAAAAETVLEPVGPSEALGALLESSALVATNGAARPSEHLALLRDVADGARGFRVRLGRDLLANPAGWARRLASDCGL